ncbi:unnamed protein product [Schistosoma mattheei]|uniref:Uncharacterized protein n=1 Tax=Schistosoma mattheei TaxID=31246 RepID=A0A183P3C4_9TREM|nr:unnamed protein product [Schistosoma mattheei]
MLEDVESFTYLGSIIDEQRGSDADAGEDWQSKGRIPTIEEHMELKTTFDQYQGQNLQYQRQNSSTVWSWNLENYYNRHQEDSSIYK